MALCGTLPRRESWPWAAPGGRRLRRGGRSHAQGLGRRPAERSQTDDRRPADRATERPTARPIFRPTDLGTRRGGGGSSRGVLLSIGRGEREPSPGGEVIPESVGTGPIKVGFGRTSVPPAALDASTRRRHSTDAPTKTDGARDTDFSCCRTSWIPYQWSFSPPPHEVRHSLCNLRASLVRGAACSLRRPRETHPRAPSPGPEEVSAVVLRRSRTVRAFCRAPSALCPCRARRAHWLRGTGRLRPLWGRLEAAAKSDCTERSRARGQRGRAPHTDTSDPGTPGVSLSLSLRARVGGREFEAVVSSGGRLCG